MDPTQQQLQNRMMATSNIQQNLQQAQGVINSDDLSPQPPIVVPPFDSGAIPDVSSIALPQDLQQSETALSREDAEIRRRILQASRQAADMSGREFELENQFGIPEQSKRVQDLTNQLRTLQNEATAIPLQVESESEGRGRTFGGAQPLINERLRSNAIQTLQTSAFLQAEQGNLSLAQSQLDRALQAEFAPLEAEMKFLQVAYAMNKDALQREDKQRASAFEFKLGERNRLIEVRLEERRNVQNTMLEAFKFGADQSTAQKIGEAQSFEEALTIGGRFLGEPFRLQMENQKFSQDMERQRTSISWKQLSLQQQANAQQATQIQLTMNKEARAELEKSQAYQNWEMRGLIASDLDNTLTEFAGTAIRDAVSYETLAESDSAVNAIATQLVYSRNPQLRRAVDLGDSDARTSVQNRTVDIIKRELGGKNISPQLLEDRIREIDTNYRSSVQARSKIVSDITRRNPDAILPEYRFAEVQPGTASKALDNIISQTQGSLRSSLENDWSVFNSK